MVKVNLELNEKEAKKYFKESKPLLKLPKLKLNIILVIIIVSLALVVFAFMFNQSLNSEYQRGYENAIENQKESTHVKFLMNQDLNYVWEWFAKRFLIILGFGLPLFFIIATIVWIIHGGFFRIA